MSSSFTSVFGGNTVYPANPSYRAFSLSANVTLAWPTESVQTGNIVAAINDVTPTGAGFAIRMPPANQASTGDTSLFFNVGADAFIVSDNSGNTIVSVSPGEAWQVYLTDNATVDGAWRANQYGAGTSSATAGSLIGAGIKAIGTTLNQAMSSTSLNVNYLAGDSDRSEVFNWVGGAGMITLPSAAVVGNDWFIHVRNSGTGGCTIATSVGGQNVNGSASIILNPGDSCIVFCDGSNYFTIGLGRSAAFAFDFVSIDLTGQPSPYNLTGANLNRVAYRFTGTITANIQVIVPSTVQQYWVTNETSLASAPYTIEIKTLTGLGVTVSRNQRTIMYCDGTNVIDADSAGISLPLSISQGGTGATTDSGARINLGATATGNALFTAASASSARSTLGASAVGDAVFIAADAAAARTAIGAGTGDGTVTSVGGTGTVNGITLTGTVTTSGNLTLGGTLSGVDLATQTTGTLAVGRGGTGQTSLTANRLVRGLGSSPVEASIITDDGISISIAGNVLMSGSTPVLTFNTGGPEISVPAANTMTFRTSGAEAMRIDSSGNVGIGNTSPAYRLDIGPGITGTIGYVARVRANASNNTSAIQFVNNATTDEQAIIQANGGGLILQASGTKDVSIRANGTERLLITSGGLVSVNFGSSAGNTLRNTTISTSAPSGGTDGDIWLRY